MQVASAAAWIVTTVLVGVDGLLMRNTCALKMHVYMPKRWPRKRAERTAAAYRKISTGSKRKFQRWSWVGAACTPHRLHLYRASSELVPRIASACTPHRPWGEGREKRTAAAGIIGGVQRPIVFVDLVTRIAGARRPCAGAHLCGLISAPRVRAYDTTPSVPFALQGRRQVGAGNLIEILFFGEM